MSGNPSSTQRVPPHTLVAGLLLAVALLAQVACWLYVTTLDATPLVGDSGELYREGLLTLHGLPERDGRPLPPLLGRALRVWLQLAGAGRGSTAAAALLVYLLLTGCSFELGRRLGGTAAGWLAALCHAGLPGAIGASRYLIPDQPAALFVAGIWICLPRTASRSACSSASRRV